MIILVTSDLHLVHPGRESVLEKLRIWRNRFRPTALIVAGDLAVASQAENTFSDLRSCFPDEPIIVCLGNHDFWVRETHYFNGLESVVERFWTPAARRYDVGLLETENIELNGLTVSGGYGHYDLGFAIPDLKYEGTLVATEHYLTGKPPIETPLRWRDFDLMPGSKDLLGLSQKQIASIKNRLSDAKNPILAVVHVPPFEPILGLKRPFPPEENPSIYAFFRAYLGNKRLGEVLIRYRDQLAGVICGHTHRVAGPVDLGGFLGLNFGSDYGEPRGWLFDTVTKTAIEVD
jgi:Icc-related predicted phosphoesterase